MGRLPGACLVTFCFFRFYSPPLLPVPLARWKPRWPRIGRASVPSELCWLDGTASTPAPVHARRAQATGVSLLPSTMVTSLVPILLRSSWSSMVARALTPGRPGGSMMAFDRHQPSHWRTSSARLRAPDTGGRGRVPWAPRRGSLHCNPRAA
jgi:hypothetical protein